MTAQPATGQSGKRDPFAPFSLDTLVSGAARLRPSTICFADRHDTMTYAAAAARSATLSRLLLEFGLRPGERVLLTGGATVDFVIALSAVVRAGLDLALAPLGIGAADLGTYARHIDAAALIGPSNYGPMSLAETYLSVAAQAHSIRMIASLGPDELDGAVDLSPAAVARFSAEHPDDGLERGKAVATAPKIVTLERVESRLTPVTHRQSTLMAAGLDLIARARIGRKTPILSTLPPTSFAGLVAGPVAALLAGAELHLEGPFDADAFLAARDRTGQPHLVVPAAISGDLVQAQVLDGLASLILVSRLPGGATPALPQTITCGCPIVDLFAVGENGVVPEQRLNGRSLGLAPEPHYINFDGSRILAVAARTSSAGGIALEGAAVTLAWSN